MDDIARRSGLPARSVAGDALEWLARQAWPGNIRELRNVLEQAALMTDDLVLTAGHFGAAAPSAAPDGTPPAPPLPLLSAPPVAAPGRDELLRPLADQVAELERAAIAAALAATAGNRVAAARLLRMSRAALYDRLQRWPELDRVAAGAA